MSFVKLPKLLKCLRCLHEWTPRGNRYAAKGETEVRICPKCKSPYWDRKREV